MNRIYLKLVEDFGEKNAIILYEIMKQKNIDAYQYIINNLKTDNN